MITVVAGLAAVLAPGAATAKVHYKHPLYKDRNTVDKAREEIGRGYACAVVTAPTTEGRRRLLIYVVSENAATRAEKVRRRLDRPRRARILLTKKRYRARTLSRIRTKLQDTAPGGETLKAVNFEGTADRSTCPRLEVMIEPPGEASEADERWAQDAESRYGEDRIVLRRVEFEQRR